MYHTVLLLPSRERWEASLPVPRSCRPSAYFVFLRPRIFDNSLGLSWRIFTNSNVYIECVRPEVSVFSVPACVYACDVLMPTVRGGVAKFRCQTSMISEGRATWCVSLFRGRLEMKSKIRTSITHRFSFPFFKNLIDPAVKSFSIPELVLFLTTSSSSILFNFPIHWVFCLLTFPIFCNLFPHMLLPPHFFCMLFWYSTRVFFTHLYGPHTHFDLRSSLSSSLRPDDRAVWSSKVHSPPPLLDAFLRSYLGSCAVPWTFFSMDHMVWHRHTAFIIHTLITYISYLHPYSVETLLLIAPCNSPYLFWALPNNHFASEISCTKL